MNKLLQGQVAIVTGGASGIGRAVTEQFIKEGARVCVFDLSILKLQELEKKYGDSILPVQGDVRNMEDHVNAINTIVSKFGRLDIYVANAGLFDGFARIDDLPNGIIDEAFWEIFNVNVKGSLIGIKAALDELRKNKGRIIFTLSNASFYPDGGGPIYTASKHAALGLMRELAFELAPDIRVNAVSPGGTITNLSYPSSLRNFARMTTDQSIRAEMIRNRNPLKIVQEPQDHTYAYVLLASNHSKAMTGTVIESDGGLGIRGITTKI